MTLVLATVLAMPHALDGQVVDHIRRAAQREAERQVDRMVRDAIQCALDDPVCVERAKRDGQPVVILDEDGNVITDENGNPITDPEEAKKRVQKPGEGIWRSYEFTPGSTVWAATDFSDEPLGRFPETQLEFLNGNMEIVEMDGVKVLEASANSTFRVNLPRELPEAFTLEFYLMLGAPNMATSVFFSPLGERVPNWYEGQYVHLYSRPGIYFQSQPLSIITGMWSLAEDMTPIKLQVDGDYAIMYVGTEKAANLPRAELPRSNTIDFHMRANIPNRSYIRDIVLAVDLDDLADALEETGEFTTRGIYFDLDSDVIRPESTPTLTEILTTLEDHPQFGIVIEGHTDSTGEEAYNQELSERRARAVVRYLVEHGVEQGRLQSVGKGEAEPAADNATPAGRQQNRRVVIKLAE
jgi:outer membrane protein OmpA-like peptidoglycan-associated protein